MDLILGTSVLLPWETVRILVAVAGVAAGAYYDLFNKKNVPNVFLYGFVAIAFAVNVLAYDPLVSLYAILQAVAVFVLTYFLLYKTGQWGGADGFILTAIALLLPVPPHPLLANPSSGVVSLPFVASVFFVSGLSFMVWMLVRSLPVALSAVRTKGAIEQKSWVGAGMIALAFFVFSLVVSNLGVMSSSYFALITGVVLLSVYFVLFMEPIKASMVEWVVLKHVEEEDILAVDRMDPVLVKKYSIGRLVDTALLARLKSVHSKIPVYKKLPPFIPHLLVGLVLSILFGDVILLLAGYSTLAF
ncbi:MAG: prepilin peptidase [Candidatus Micrarchaeota archaeon]